MKGGEPKSKT